MTESSDPNQQRADKLKDILNEGVALQVELLGAAVRIWSTMFESMAAYTKTASEELSRLTSGGDANAALDKVMTVAQAKLDELEKLPEQIGQDFSRKVKQRARVKVKS
jgi:hypothetical protein